MKNIKNNFGILFTVGLLMIIVFDYFDLDNFFYLFTCSLIRKFKFSLTCSMYYDLPIWDVLVSFGTIIAGYFAYRAIIQSNKQLETSNSPYLVMKNNLGVSVGPKIHMVEFKNVSSTGLAANVRITADSNGRILIGDSSNADSKDLSPNQSDSLAVDENKLIQGLVTQGIKINKNIVEEVDSLKLFLWYEDIFGNKYKTTSLFVKSDDIKPKSENHFLKIKSNLVEKVK